MDDPTPPALPMNDLQFAADVLAKIRAHDARYHARAYLFVLASVEFFQGRLPYRRHVTGGELAWACRDFALQQYGLLARPVLGWWGLGKTEDFGNIVFTLVEVGLLMTQPGDRVEEFAGVYDFAEAFSAAYVWEGVSRA